MRYDIRGLGERSEGRQEGQCIMTKTRSNKGRKQNFCGFANNFLLKRTP